MTIENKIVEISHDISDLAKYDSNKLHWLRGDPSNPDKGFLILYQRHADALNFEYEYFSAMGETNIEVSVGSTPHTGSMFQFADNVSLKGIKPDKGYINLDILPKMHTEERNWMDRQLNVIKEMSRDSQGILRLDVILAPFGFDQDSARTIILGNYVMHYLGREMSKLGISYRGS